MEKIEPKTDLPLMFSKPQLTIMEKIGEPDELRFDKKLRKKVKGFKRQKYVVSVTETVEAQGSANDLSSQGFVSQMAPTRSELEYSIEGSQMSSPKSTA